MLSAPTAPDGIIKALSVALKAVSRLCVVRLLRRKRWS